MICGSRRERPARKLEVGAVERTPERMTYIRSSARRNVVYAVADVDRFVRRESSLAQRVQERRRVGLVPLRVVVEHAKRQEFAQVVVVERQASRRLHLAGDDPKRVSPVTQSFERFAHTLERSDHPVVVRGLVVAVGLEHLLCGLCRLLGVLSCSDGVLQQRFWERPAQVLDKLAPRGERTARESPLDHVCVGCKD
ncbi:MAG: hypothetical protein WKH64_10735 [Chloroflexia bacterium]